MLLAPLVDSATPLARSGTLSVEQKQQQQRYRKKLAQWKTEHKWNTTLLLSCSVAARAQRRQDVRWSAKA